MFEFFLKKDFLVDHLRGLVDIHNHILPGIDDGAKSIDDAIELIKGFNEFGVTRFICTPHIMHNYYPNTPKSIGDAHKILNKALIQQGMESISLGKAAEHMIDDNFEHILNTNEVMTLGKYHLLIEMSFLQPSINFSSSLDKIISKGLFPILAHPERYLYMSSNSKRLKSYKDKGTLLQLNLLSLTDQYGNDVKSKALKLLDNKMIDFVGSDVHNTRQLKQIKEATISKKIAKQLNPLINRTIEEFF